MSVMKRYAIAGIAALFAALLGADMCAAQTYPSKPVKFIVPFPAGGATDLLTRTVAQRLSDSMGQPVVVDNRPGGGANIGSAIAAKSPADGYTILMTGVMPLAINPHIYRNMGYDPQKDLAPITVLASVTNILVVNPSLPVKSVKDLIELAKAKPGQLNFASSGSGSSPHLSGEMFKALTGTQMVHVPYKGSAPAMQDLLGGQVSLMFDNLPSALPHIKAGKLRALGVTQTKRSPLLPDVPPIAEAGVPGYEATSWFAVAAPAGTPKDVLARLHAEFTKMLNAPDMKDRLAGQGYEPVGYAPDEFATFWKAEYDKWGKVAKVSGARVD